MAHRNRHHLPGRIYWQRALGDEDRIEVEHAAVRHHQLGVAPKWHWGLVEAFFVQLGAGLKAIQWAQTILIPDRPHQDGHGRQSEGAEQ